MFLSLTLCHYMAIRTKYEIKYKVVCRLYTFALRQKSDGNTQV